MRLGQAELHRIIDIDPFPIVMDFLIPDALIGEMQAHADVLAPDHVDFQAGTVLLGLQSYVLKAGGLNVLIDACVGEHKERPIRPDWHRRSDTGYLAALARAGLRPEDIDVVLCTHLHADHVGWNTRLENGRWVPTFPRARYLIGVAELAHWQEEERIDPGRHNHGAYADSVLPVVEAGLVDVVEGGFSLGPGMRIVPLPGHSPGQIGLDLDCGADGHALFCGDAFHSPVQVYRPHWSSRFCADPVAAARMRVELLEQSQAEGTMLIPAHIRNATGLRARRLDGGFHPVMF